MRGISVIPVSYTHLAAAEKFMKNLKLAAIETHVADARTCCLNPATSTHRQMTDEQLEAAGVPAGLVRISCEMCIRDSMYCVIGRMNLG